MTNSWQSSALKAVGAAALAALAGCGGPDDGSAEYAAGNTAYAARDLVKAERQFTASLAEEPGNVNALIMLARTELDLGKIDEAGAAIAQAESLAGGDTDVMLLAAQIAFHARDFGKAKTLYAMIAEDARLTPADRAAGWAGLGVVEMSGINSGAATEGRDIARTCFLRAVRLDGRNAAARYHLGVLYMNAFAYRESALDQFGIFVRLDTEADKRVQDVQQKTIPALRNEIAAAASRRDGVSRRDSAASASALRKAEEAWNKGTYKTARLRYAEAYQADVLSYPAALGLAKSWEKSDLSKSGQLEASKYYCIASSLRPSAKDTALAAGGFAFKLGNFASAVEAYSRALAAAPTDVTAIDGLIRALQKSGNRSSAVVYQRYRDWLATAKR